MTRIITDEQAKYAHEHSQLVSGSAMRQTLSNEWDAYIRHVREQAWDEGCRVGFEADSVDIALFETGEADPNPYRPEVTE